MIESMLLECCGSRAWVDSVMAGWPYPSSDELLDGSERAFDALTREGWLEAFAAHAKIGQPRAGDERGTSEQAGVREAGADVLDELARLNLEYDRRFGHVFLICATGLSAEQMLASLRSRIENPAAREFETATVEQRKITRLRLSDRFGA